jgi:hypothetical protein
MDGREISVSLNSRLVQIVCAGFRRTGQINTAPASSISPQQDAERCLCGMLCSQSRLGIQSQFSE